MKFEHQEDENRRLEALAEGILDQERIKQEAYRHADMEIAKAERLDAFPLLELMLKNIPLARWIVEGIIPSGAITMISGDPATFKTWLMLELALCVSEGRPLFGQFEVEKVPVLIIDEENDQGLLQKRLRMLKADIYSDIYLTSLAGFKINDSDVSRVLEICTLHNIKLVIIDSFVRVHNIANENDAAAIAAVFEKMKPFIRAGVAVVFTHHHGKRAGSESLQYAMRGSSDILASVASHLAVVKGEDKTLLLTHTKSRMAEEIGRFQLEIKSGDNYFEFTYIGSDAPQPGKKQNAKQKILEILVELEHPPFQQEILKLLNEGGANISERTLRSLLIEMESGGELIKGKGDRNRALYYLAPPPTLPIAEVPANTADP